jgi:hypothetical protein
MWPQDHQASDLALKEAIQAFPEVVPLLADKADISLSSQIRSHRVFQIVTEGYGFLLRDFFADLYHQRLMTFFTFRTSTPNVRSPCGKIQSEHHGSPTQ